MGSKGGEKVVEEWTIGSWHDDGREMRSHESKKLRQTSIVMEGDLLLLSCRTLKSQIAAQSTQSVNPTVS